MKVIRRPLQGKITPEHGANSWIGSTANEPVLTIPVGAKRRNPNTTKTLVVIAVEMLEPKGFGRIRLRRITDATAHQVIPFVKDVVQAGATVHTDGFAAYRSLKDEGYTHQRTVMMGSETPAHISMPGVHRVASLIQRWLLGHASRCGTACEAGPLP